MNRTEAMVRNKKGIPRRRTLNRGSNLPGLDTTHAGLNSDSGAATPSTPAKRPYEDIGESESSGTEDLAMSQRNSNSKSDTTREKNRLAKKKAKKVRASSESCKGDAAIDGNQASDRSNEVDVVMKEAKQESAIINKDHTKDQTNNKPKEVDTTHTAKDLGQCDPITSGYQPNGKFLGSTSSAPSGGYETEEDCHKDLEEGAKCWENIEGAGMEDETVKQAKLGSKIINVKVNPPKDLNIATARISTEARTSSQSSVKDKVPGSLHKPALQQVQAADQTDSDNDTVMLSTLPLNHQQAMSGNTASASADAKGTAAVQLPTKSALTDNPQGTPSRPVAADLVKTPRDPKVPRGAYGSTANVPGIKDSTQNARRVDQTSDRMAHVRVDKVIDTAPAPCGPEASRNARSSGVDIHGSNGAAQIDLTHDEDEVNTFRSFLNHLNPHQREMLNQWIKDRYGGAKRTNGQATSLPRSASTQDSVKRCSSSGINKTLHAENHMPLKSSFPRTETGNSQAPASHANSEFKFKPVPATSTEPPTLIPSLFFQGLAYVLPNGPKAWGLDLSWYHQGIEIWRDEAGGRIDGPRAGVFLYNPESDNIFNIIHGGQPRIDNDEEPMRRRGQQFERGQLIDKIREAMTPTESATQNIPHPITDNDHSRASTEGGAVLYPSEADLYKAFAYFMKFLAAKAEAEAKAAGGQHPNGVGLNDTNHDAHTPHPGQKFRSTSFPSHTTIHRQLANRSSAMHPGTRTVQVTKHGRSLNTRSQSSNTQNQPSNVPEPFSGPLNQRATIVARQSVRISDPPRDKRRERVGSGKQTQNGSPSHPAEAPRHAPTSGSLQRLPDPSLAETPKAPAAYQKNHDMHTPSGLTGHFENRLGFKETLLSNGTGDMMHGVTAPKRKSTQEE